MWILEHTAHRLGDTTGVGRDRLTGFGLLDVTAAVKLADGPPGEPAAAGRRRAERRRQDAQILPISNGSIDAVADFGDDRRDVYKLSTHAGDTLRVSTEPLRRWVAISGSTSPSSLRARPTSPARRSARL